MTVILFLLATLVVGFGQPATSTSLSIASAIAGPALAFTMLKKTQSTRSAFFLGFAWFTTVQLLQSIWFLTHPYLYIYTVWITLAVFWGLQFGLWSALFKKHPDRIYSLAALWALLEWSRLYFFSGYPFNPVGLALTAHSFPLQFASLGGVYFLTFWVMLTNLILLRNLSGWMVLVILPYVFGYLHIQLQDTPAEKNLKTLLIQPNFPVEESLGISSASEWARLTFHEWSDILRLVSKHKVEGLQLVVLPETVLPFEAYRPLFPGNMIEDLVQGHLDVPATFQEAVSHADIAQFLADHLNADVILGAELEVDGAFHSSALCFLPGKKQTAHYDKRVLVPMGEYIPFSFLKTLAASYGITGSFEPGKSATVFRGTHTLYGPSICYEEAYGHLVLESRTNGARLLVNLTNDGWYPESTLAKQHFTHARLRTVETGLPLVRSCNTGVTGAVDNLGRTIARIPEDTPEALVVDVPLGEYQTLYGLTGDGPWMIGATLLSLLLFRRRDGT